MYKSLFIGLCLVFAACSEADQFASYQREVLGEVSIGSSVSKQIVLQNPSIDGVQHIVGLNFEAGDNAAGHFRIDNVEVGGVAQNPRDKDISVPAGSILQIYITYEPLNLQTSVADYGGWRTGAIEAMSSLVGKASDEDIVYHRAIVAVVYDRPQIGIVEIEVIGEALPGPNGEVTAVGGSQGECAGDAGTACYTGGFAIELPDIMAGGPKQLKMTGPAVFEISGSSLAIDMGTFPAVLLVLEGNGPGEPLEGKPINAVSIIISGTEDVTATGTFDGSRLELNGVAFRIRVVLGEITEADITPGLQAAVDFDIKDISLTTSKPYTNGSITLMVEAVLSKQPSGNPMFDQFLGGTRVVVTMDGTLTVY